MDDCFGHVARMKKVRRRSTLIVLTTMKSQIFFSVIAPRHIDALQKLFDCVRTLIDMQCNA